MSLIVLIFIIYTYLFSDKIQNEVDNNIMRAQELQKNNYAKRHLSSDSNFKIGDKVLLKNLRRSDRKGGWALQPWLGPYQILKIINNKLCILKNGDKILKTKQLLSNMKKYNESTIHSLNTCTIDDSLDNKCINKEPKDHRQIIQDVPYTQNISVCNSDVQYITTYQVDINRFFNPVGKGWQRTKCRQLKCNLVQSLEYTNRVKVLNTPSSIKNIIGDGNCLFRALS